MNHVRFAVVQPLLRIVITPISSALFVMTAEQLAQIEESSNRHLRLKFGTREYGRCPNERP